MAWNKVMPAQPVVAVAGATGVVGREMLKVLEQRDFPAAKIKALASARSAGSTVPFKDGELVVVDFKTDRIGRTQIEERAEYYRPQLEAYSMALMRVMGKKVREKVLYFFSVGEEKML